jgi:Cu-Zn family superoxide dismutase
LEWKKNSAIGCDFLGNDIERFKNISFNECLTKCLHSQKCTHLIWEETKREPLCKLKKGNVTKKDAIAVANSKLKCSIIDKSKTKPIDMDCELYELNYATGRNFNIRDRRVVHFAQDDADTELKTFRSIKLRKDCVLKLCHTFKINEQCDHYTYDYEFSRNKPMPQTATCLCDKIKDNLLLYSRKSTKSGRINFKQKGKGTIRFAIRPLPMSVKSYQVKLGTRHETELNLNFQNNDVSISKSAERGSLKFKKTAVNKPLVNLVNANASDSYIWISVEGTIEEEESLNISYFIKIGYGYVYEKNLLFKFVPVNNKAKAFVSEIEFIQVDKRTVIANMQYFICFSSFFRDKYPILADTNSQTDIKIGHITKSNFPREAQDLYNSIKDASLRSEILDAINYSIDTEGCILNEKINLPKSVFSETNSASSSYIRVSLIRKATFPVVIEIWPKGQSSPIHNNGDCVAVIKVLKGSLQLDFYNPLANISFTRPVKINSVKLHESNFTYMTPDFFQTHQIHNYRDDTAAIIIKSYTYLENDSKNTNMERINYVVPENPDLKVFYPESDYLLDEKFENALLREYQTKTCGLKAKSCEFKSKICGSVLKELTRYRKDKSVNENSIYECDESLKEVEKCGPHAKCIYSKCVKNLVKKAMVNIMGFNSKSNSQVLGRLELEMLNFETVRIKGEINGLNKQSKHGFHIHESRKSSGNGCTDLGPHFGPHMTDKHGDLTDEIFNRHLGDIGNIDTDEFGNAVVDLKMSQITLEFENEFNIVNRSIAIHQDRDDLGQTSHENSRKNGNSGTIIACGQIRLIEQLEGNDDDDDDSQSTTGQDRDVEKEINMINDNSDDDVTHIPESTTESVDTSEKDDNLNITEKTNKTEEKMEDNITLTLESTDEERVDKKNEETIDPKYKDYQNKLKDVISNSKKISKTAEY